MTGKIRLSSCISINLLSPVLLLLFAPLANAIVSGETVSGVIGSEDEIHSYSFVASAGEDFILNVGHTGGHANFLARISVHDINGVALPDATGKSAFAYTSPISTVYTVNVHDQRFYFSGSYNLSFVRGTGGADGGQIVNGETKFGSLGFGDLDSYRFTVNAGDQFTVNVNEVGSGPPFIVQMSVYGPNGSLLPNSEDRFEFAYTAQVSGSYMVVVYDSGFADSGSYNLYFSRTCGVTVNGDINGDCALTIADLLIFEQAVTSQITLTAEQFNRADIFPADTGDGILDVSDQLEFERVILAQ